MNINSLEEYSEKPKPGMGPRPLGYQGNESGFSGDYKSMETEKYLSTRK